MASTQLTLNQTTLLGATTGTIACLLAPIAGRQLLLPNVTVAEVVPVNELLSPPAGAAPWHQGFVKWNDIEVPIVSFELMNGESSAHECQHVVILSSISGSAQLPQYGIGIQSEPRVAKVKIAQLEDLEGAAVGSVEFLQVKYAGELAVIPDLDAIEARLAP